MRISKNCGHLAGCIKSRQTTATGAFTNVVGQLKCLRTRYLNG
jgi:hypothetical protein